MDLYSEVRTETDIEKKKISDSKWFWGMKDKSTYML